MDPWQVGVAAHWLKQSGETQPLPCHVGFPCGILWYQATYTISKGLYSSHGFLLPRYWMVSTAGFCCARPVPQPGLAPPPQGPSWTISFPSSTPLCWPVQMRLCAWPFLGVPVQSCRTGLAWMMNAGWADSCFLVQKGMTLQEGIIFFPKVQKHYTPCS